MTVNDFSALYDYASWANGQLLAVVKQLTPQQFTRDVAGSYGSVRNTMVHMLSAEWGWLDRCGGPSRGAKLNPDDYPTVESLSETWARVEGYMREFLSRLTDEDLARVIEFALPGGPQRALPMRCLLQHSVVHGIHHRGQVALLLRELGVAPGNVDLLIHDLQKQPLGV